jgi:maleate cis-trans isomerase
MEGLALVDNLIVGRLGPETAYDLAMKVNRAEADTIALSCTNWQTMDAIERIERDTGKPVVSTTQATIWAALRAIGHTEPISGYGRLLRELGTAR